MEQNSFAKKLVMYRKKKGYTQQQLADLLEISNKTVSRWETGEGYPDITMLVPLCDIFDISCDELLRENQNYTELGKNDIQKYRSFLIIFAGYVGYYIVKKVGLPFILAILMLIVAAVYAFHLTVHHTDKKQLPNLTRFLCVLSFFPISEICISAMFLLAFGAMLDPLLAAVLGGGMTSQEYSLGSDPTMIQMVLSALMPMILLALVICVVLYVVLKHYLKHRYDIIWTPLFSAADTNAIRKSKWISSILTLITVLVFFGYLYYSYEQLQSGEAVYDTILNVGSSENLLIVLKGKLFMMLLPALFYTIYTLIRYPRHRVYLRNLGIIIYLAVILWKTYLDVYYLTSPQGLIIVGAVIIIAELMVEAFLYYKSHKKEGAA